MSMNIGDLKRFTDECERIENQINFINKKIDETNNRIGETALEANINEILIKRINMMKEEKKLLINELKDLRDNIGKITFKNYNVTDNKNEFGLISELEEFDYTKNTNISSNDEELDDEEEIQSGLKVVCNGDKYRFYIKLRNGDTDLFDIPVSKIYLRHKKLVKKTRRRYKINKKFAKNIDMNLFFGLIKVDELYNTSYSDDYINNRLNAKIVYNNNKLVQSKKLKVKDKINQYLISLKQEKYVGAKINHYKPFIGPIAALITISIFPTVANARKMRDVNDAKAVETTVDNRVQETNNKITEQAIKVTTELYENNNTKKEKKVVTKKVSDESNGFKIGDRLRLVYKDDNGNVKRCYKVSNDVTGQNKTYADEFNCDYFKISGIYAFLDGNNVDVANNVSNIDVTTNEFYRKYGSDIDIYLDFDGYIKGNDTAVCQSIGFINLDEITHFSTETKRKIATSKSHIYEDEYTDMANYYKDKNTTENSNLTVINTNDIVRVGSSNEVTTEEVTTENITTEATTEVTTEKVTTEATTEKVTTEATTEKVTTEEKTTEEVTTENKKEIINTEERTTLESLPEKIKYEVNKLTKAKEKNSDNLGIGLNDKVKIAYDDPSKSLTLTEDAWGNGNSVLANNLNCDYFRVSCIAAFKDDKLLATIKANNENAKMRTNELYEKYGKDIDIAFNFDGYSNDNCKYKYVGWLNIKQLYHKNTDSKNYASVKSLSYTK